MLTITFYDPEIFLYGGQVGGVWLGGLSPLQNINAGFDEVYILSLPSFVWFKVNYTSSDPRIHHTCNIVGQRQMLSIGGINPSAVNISAAYNNTDPYWEGIKVFDLTKLQWTNYYNANAAPYVSPSAIAAHYATGPRYPSTWSSSGLKNLFEKPKSNSSTSTEPIASASPLPGTPKTTTTTTTNRKAAVIGAVVGGVAGAALAVFAFYLFIRKRGTRRSHQREKSKLPPTNTISEPHPLGNISEIGQGFAHEADSRWAMPYEVDSRQAMPYEVDSGQNFPHEADSGVRYELSSRMRAGHVDVH